MAAHLLSEPSWQVGEGLWSVLLYVLGCDFYGHFAWLDSFLVDPIVLSLDAESRPFMDMVFPHHAEERRVQPGHGYDTLSFLANCMLGCDEVREQLFAFLYP